MAFIRSCNGKFEKEKHQKKYDEFKEASSIAQNTVEDFLIVTVKSRLKVRDVHYDLIDSMLAISKSNLNMTRQAILPMIIDLYEYTIKLLKSKGNEKLPQRELFLAKENVKAKEQFNFIFDKLQDALKKSISTLEGKQEVETLYKYFSSINEEDIKKELKTNHNIIDTELLDGFMAFRKKYGFFLKQSYEHDVKHAMLSKELNPLKKQEYVERWNGICKVVTEDMYNLKKRQLQAESYASIKDKETKNILRGFGVFQSVNKDIDKINKEITQKLDELFSEKYLIVECKAPTI